MTAVPPGIAGNSDAAVLLGVDVGGTKVEVCEFTGLYELVSSTVIPTAELAPGSPELAGNLEALIGERVHSNTRRVGVAMRGVAQDGLITHSSLLGGSARWPLAERLADRLGIPAVVQNDVVAMARAEHRFGRGRHAKSFLFINLGTGIRLALVEEGRLLSGFTGVAGELPPRFRAISGEGIAEHYRQLTGEGMTAREIFEYAGQPIPKQVIIAFAEQLAELMSEASFFYNPEEIVLAGSLVRSGPRYLSRVESLYRIKTPLLCQARSIMSSRLEHQACLGSVLSPDAAD